MMQISCHLIIVKFMFPCDHGSCVVRVSQSKAVTDEGPQLSLFLGGVTV